MMAVQSKRMLAFSAVSLQRLAHGKPKPETQELSGKASSYPVYTQPVLLYLVSWRRGQGIRHRCTQLSSFDSQYSFYTPIGSSWHRNTLWVGELCIILHCIWQTHNVLASETARRSTGLIRSTSVLHCVTASKKSLTNQADASPAFWFLIVCYWVVCYFFLISNSCLRQIFTRNSI